MEILFILSQPPNNALNNIVYSLSKNIESFIQTVKNKIIALHFPS